ncbi:type II toxin-antitoxin system HicA family toxin [Deltaproteobacteria bacterium TL4]
MKIPRSISGKMLVKALERLNYQVSRQTGSHIRLTYTQEPQHHITIPNHDPLRVGTLSAILSEIAQQLKINRDDLIKRLF